MNHASKQERQLELRRSQSHGGKYWQGRRCMMLLHSNMAVVQLEFLRYCWTFSGLMWTPRAGKYAFSELESNSQTCRTFPVNLRASALSFAGECICFENSPFVLSAAWLSKTKEAPTAAILAAAPDPAAPATHRQRPSSTLNRRCVLRTIITITIASALPSWHLDFMAHVKPGKHEAFYSCSK